MLESCPHSLLYKLRFSRTMSAKLLVPVALGLSLITVTAFVVYYVFKKDEEDDTTPSKNTVKTSRINVIEINVPKSIVPALIGESDIISFKYNK